MNHWDMAETLPTRHDACEHRVVLTLTPDEETTQYAVCVHCGRQVWRIVDHTAWIG